MGRIALTVFSIGRFVLENALGGVIPSLFGTLFTTKRMARVVLLARIVDKYAPEWLFIAHSNA